MARRLKPLVPVLVPAVVLVPALVLAPHLQPAARLAEECLQSKEPVQHRRRPHHPLCFLASTSSAPSLTDPQASVARRLKPLVPALALAPHLQEAARLVD